MQVAIESSAVENLQDISKYSAALTRSAFSWFTHATVQLISPGRYRKADEFYNFNRRQLRSMILIIANHVAYLQELLTELEDLYAITAPEAPMVEQIPKSNHFVSNGKAALRTAFMDTSA